MLPLINPTHRFPRPDWAAVEKLQSPTTPSDAESHRFWTECGREWVHLLRQALGEGYIGYESTHFWLVSREPAATCRRLISWAEETRRKVLQALALDVSDKLFGKCPILVVHDLDTYYEYVAGYLPDGEHGASSGMYITRGYGHFIFAFHEMETAQTVLAHELTHSLVSHLPLPFWLNEGVAQLCEEVATGRDSTNYEEIRETIDSYWTRDSMQDFWSGRGFTRPDEGQAHSYHLARVLARKLARDRERFRQLLDEANGADAGDDAVRRHYGISLEELVESYLGPGDWAVARTSQYPAAS